MRRIAVIGGGIAGLGAAWFLRRDFDVTVIEAEARPGGHSNTALIEENGREIPIDTGFMVFNRVTYPHLTRLFETLAVPVKRTDMSFSVSHRPRRIEFCGSDWNRLFAQRRNLFRPSFLRMLLQVDRFNREAVPALEDRRVDSMSLGDYLGERGYGADFADLYLVPMSSAVWSTPPGGMLQFPASTLLRFFHNHGFLGLHAQHPWWTVEGGSRKYVERIAGALRGRIRLGDPARSVRRLGRAGVEVTTGAGTQRYDRVVLACHPPESLRLLGGEATPRETRLLGCFRYQPNWALLHTDAAVMPRTRRAWASWNYRMDAGDTGLRPSTHYWMNRLQGVSERRDYFVSINAGHLVDPAKVLRSISYEHPLFDLAARDAQPGIASLNAAAAGRTETYFAGAWQRYGFHEDGLLSAVNVAELILGRDPWREAA